MHSGRFLRRLVMNLATATVIAGAALLPLAVWSPIAPALADGDGGGDNHGSGGGHGDDGGSGASGEGGSNAGPGGGDDGGDEGAMREATTAAAVPAVARSQQSRLHPREVVVANLSSRLGARSADWASSSSRSGRSRPSA